MTLRHVDPRVIGVPDVRITNVMDDDTLSSFDGTIAAMGVQEPLIVTETEDGLVLVDGFHRLQAALEHGIEKVPVVVTKGSAVDVLLRNLVLSTQRGKPPLGDIVRVVGHLYQEEGIGIEEIQEKTGLSQRLVEDALLIAGAGDAVMKAVDEELIGKGQALVLAQIASADQRDLILHQTIAYRWTVRELQDQMARVREEEQRGGAPPVGAEPPPPPVYLCSGCQQETEPARLAHYQLCPSCSATLYEINRAAPPPPPPEPPPPAP